jgi:hypothetical protein
MRQPDFATAGRPPRAAAWQRLALAACALAALASLWLALDTKAQARAAQRRVAEVERELRTAVARREQLAARLRGPGGNALSAEDARPARILAELAARLPAAARLDRLAIDYQAGGRLELQVVARDAETWDRLLRSLEAAPHLQELEPGPETRAAEVRSQVRARWEAGSR